VDPPSGNGQNRSLRKQ